MATAPATLQRVARMSFGQVYPLYVAKLERKGRTPAELDEVITWLTGFDQTAIARHVADQTTFAVLRAIDLEPESVAHHGRHLRRAGRRDRRAVDAAGALPDKLVDELAKGKTMEKVLRS